jgi:hypothetical protein
VRIPAAITNIATPALNSKYFSDSMATPPVVLLFVFGKTPRNLRAAGKRHANDLSKNEFFDQ